MKVLVCAINAPWPTRGGGNLRCWQSLNLLREWAEVGLFALAGTAHPPPEFRSSIWHVTGSAVTPVDQPSWIKQEGALPSDAYYHDRSAAELRRLLEEFQPDVVVLDNLWMHGYEKVVRSSDARIVLNAHNAEAELARQLAEQESFPPIRLQLRLFATRVARLEGDFAARMDQIWVCSEHDRMLFQEEYRARSPLHLVPNAIEPSRYREASDRPRELDGFNGPSFLFTGVFDYAPNRKAVDFLIVQLFPRLVQAYPDCRLVLAGANPSRTMLDAAEQDARIIVTGKVPDTIPYLRHSSMMLVPLFAGGGTRFKIIEAFAARLPVVSSSKGAEGLGAEPGKHLLLAETADSFLEAIHEILYRPELTHRMVDAAAELVERFSWRTAGQAVGRALRELAT